LGKITRAFDRLEEVSSKDEPSLAEVQKINNETAPEKVYSFEQNQEKVPSREEPLDQTEHSRIPKRPLQEARRTASTEHWDEKLKISTSRLSVVGENIHKLRAKILHPEDGKKIRSILITSSSPQEGKSFICSNLAISIAKSIKRHALMVDCDLRRPNLHALFGTSPEKGLADYLLHRESIPSLLQPTGLDKLSLIPAGMPPENPSELLSAENMAALVDEMAARYDDRLLLLDTPPLHAASETLVLSQMVDKIIFVVRWGKSSPDEVEKAVEQLNNNKILGIVFNAFETNILDRATKGLSYQSYYSGSYNT